LLLGGSGLLVVLIVRHVILISTIGGVGVSGSIVLSIRAIVGTSSGRSSRVSGAGRGTGRLLVMLLMTVVVSISVTAASATTVVTVSTAAAVATIIVLWGIVLEVLILFPDVGQEIFAELLGCLDVIRVRATLENELV
jgi:hypothetical protein